MAVAGTVAVLTGFVVATHADATQSVLAVGSPIMDGDVIETGSGASVSIRFLDDTTLAMDADARMAIDALVFDPATGSGSAGFQLFEGLFVIVTGAIAASGPEALRLTTPVATIGIRGTSLAILAGAEGTRNLVALLADPGSGDLGEAVILNAGGTQVLDEANEATAITSSDVAPLVPFLLSRHQLEALFGGAILASPFGGRLYEEPDQIDGSPSDQSTEEERRADDAAATQAEGDDLSSVAADTEPTQVTDATFAGPIGDGTASTSDGFDVASGAATFDSGSFQGSTTSGTETGETAADPASTNGGDRDPGGGGGGGDPDNTDVGGAGGDTLVGTIGRDSLIGGRGDDLLDGRGGNDVFDGGDGRDQILGGPGIDRLLGGANDDSLLGGGGNDVIDGGPGIDSAFYVDATGPVRVNLGIAGPQAVGGGLGSDDLREIEQLSGSPFDDVLTGDGVANNLKGHVGDDVLFGDEGRDDLIGGAGSDFLIGGADGDDVTGGLAADFFAYELSGDGARVATNVTAASAGLTAGVEYDRLLDFSAVQGDLVGLRAVPFDLPQGPPLVSGVNFSRIAGLYDGTNAGANSEFTAGRPTMVFSTADNTLYYDPDGATPGYTVLAAVNVALDATDIRTF